MKCRRGLPTSDVTGNYSCNNQGAFRAPCRGVKMTGGAPSDSPASVGFVGDPSETCDRVPTGVGS